MTDVILNVFTFFPSQVSDWVGMAELCPFPQALAIPC